MIQTCLPNFFLCNDNPALNLPLISLVCIDLLAELAPRTLAPSVKAVNTHRVEKLLSKTHLLVFAAEKRESPQNSQYFLTLMPCAARYDVGWETLTGTRQGNKKKILNVRLYPGTPNILLPVTPSYDLACPL